MKVLGVDASTVRCGFAVATDDPDSPLLYYMSMSFKSSDPHRMRRLQVKQAVRELVKQWEPDFIILERIRMFHQGHISLDTIVRLAAMWGAIVDATRVDVFSVNTVTWKAAVLGNGRADKTAAVKYVEKKYSIKATHDLADAVCIAEYGLNPNWGEKVVKEK